MESSSSSSNLFAQAGDSYADNFRTALAENAELQEEIAREANEIKSRFNQWKK